MAFKIQCPGCESKLKLAEAPTKDMKLKCPKCEKVIKVKAAAAPTAVAKKTEEPATASAPKAVAAAGKAAAKAKASAKPTKAKASKATSKKKKKRAPANDDWDDYEDFNDDLDDFEDDYNDGADDFDEPKPKRGKKKKGAAAAGKGKKAPAKSGGKGLKIALSVLLGVGLLGGTIFGVMKFMGDDDTTTASTDGDGTNSGAGGSEANGTSSVAATGGDAANAAAADAAGQNVVNMQYLPEKIDFFVHAKLADIMASPLFEAFKDKIPPEALSSTGPVKPEDVDSFIFASWIPPQASQAAIINPNDAMVPAMQQNGAMGGGMNQGGMSGPPAGFGGQGGPPPGFGGQGPTPPQLEEFVVVLRLKRDFSAADFGAVKSTSEHKGQTIHEVTDPNTTETSMMWLADSRTVVGGKLDQVKGAIDQGTNERRFKRFDFAEANTCHVLVALAPRDPNVFKRRPPSGMGMPPVQIPPTISEGMKGACLQIEATEDLKLLVRIECRDSSSADALHKDVASGIVEGKKALEAQAKGPMAFILPPFQKIVNRVNSNVSGELVSINIDASKDELMAAGKTVGLAMAMGGMGGGMNGGGPPAGMSGFGGPPEKDDIPFSKQEEDASVSYTGDIAPILKWRCGSCHIDKSDGGLSLATYDSLMAHSSDKGKAVTANEPDASSLLSYVSSPPEGHPKIKDSEVSSIQKWIEEGAKGE
jgi:phage FluMu protein Com